jgi:hypothetical protein
MAAWDQADIGRDRAKMIEILMATELSAEQAAFATETMLAIPRNMGFRRRRGSHANDAWGRYPSAVITRESG